MGLDSDWMAVALKRKSHWAWGPGLCVLLASGICLLTLGQPGAAFACLIGLWLYAFVAALFGVGADPDFVARQKALRLQPILEQQIREWEEVIKEVKNTRKSLRKTSDHDLLAECDRLLKYARREQRAQSCRRKEEHQEAFNMAYYVLQHRDERRRPTKFVVHRGLCASVTGKDKRSIFGSTEWHGPYEDRQFAHGGGTRRYCSSCCSDLLPLRNDPT